MSENDAKVLIYITTETPEEAREIAAALIGERLAACANIIDGMTSIYHWQGRIEEGTETILVAKTRDTLVERLTARVRTLHSADCPCVVALPLTGGNPEFLTWIGQETSA